MEFSVERAARRLYLSVRSREKITNRRNSQRKLIRAAGVHAYAPAGENTRSKCVIPATQKPLLFETNQAAVRKKVAPGVPAAQGKNMCQPINLFHALMSEG
jgi:hypothetical protein